MIKRSALPLIALAMLLLAGGHVRAAAPIMGDLSNYSIRIDSSFHGTRLFVFGARNEGGDVIVVIRGPNKNFMVRKKEPIGGIWVNRKRMKFYQVPDFYAVASSKPLDVLSPSRMYEQLEIGSGYLLSPPPQAYMEGDFDEFRAAFLRQKQKNRLYSEVMKPVTFMADTLFKTVIEFPDNIPSGTYTAEIYLFSDGDLVGTHTTPIVVEKQGLDAFLHYYAHEQPFLYGITAIFMALGVGWLTARLFEKF